MTRTPAIRVFMKPSSLMPCEIARLSPVPAAACDAVGGLCNSNRCRPPALGPDDSGSTKILGRCISCPLLQRRCVPCTAVEHLVLAFTVGLGAGITPGPLQTLVVTTALQRGFPGGWRVAIGPLLTDAPIVALSLAVVSRLAEPQLRVLAMTGGGVVILFGLHEMWAARRPLVEVEAAGSRDLWRGAIVNLTNPHPWLFWFGVGSPALVAAWRDSVAFGLGFLFIFYGLLVGSKVALAAFVAAGQKRLNPQARQRLLFAGGGLLVVAGVILVLSRI